MQPQNCTRLMYEIESGTALQQLYLPIDGIKMKTLIKNLIQLSIFLPVFVILSCSVMHRDTNWSQYDSNPFVIYLDIPSPEDDKGSCFN